MWLVSPRSLVSVILVSVITTLLCCDYFSSSSVESCAFSVLCVYSKFGRHRHPLRYLRFFSPLHCSASPWRKMHTQSFNHSPSLFDALGTEALALRKYKPDSVHISVNDDHYQSTKGSNCWYKYSGLFVWQHNDIIHHNLTVLHLYCSRGWDITFPLCII